MKYLEAKCGPTKLSDSNQLKWWGMPTEESAIKDSLKCQEPPTGGINPYSFCHHMLLKLQEHYVFVGACIPSDPSKFPLIAWQSKVNKEAGVLFHKFDPDTILLPSYMSPEVISEIKRKSNLLTWLLQQLEAAADTWSGGFPSKLSILPSFGNVIGKDHFQQGYITFIL
jgi:hypothetical protein